MRAICGVIHNGIVPVLLIISGKKPSVIKKTRFFYLRFGRRAREKKQWKDDEFKSVYFYVQGLPDQSFRIPGGGFFNPLSAGDAFKRIHTVFLQLKFDRN